jgi:hypothetical protein
MQLVPGRPALRQIVSEAARALAQLDAARLEELALSCQALNRDLKRELTGQPPGDLPRALRPESRHDGEALILPIKEEERAQLAAEARAAQRDMEIFARMLEATRANVQVIERLRELRMGRVEYSAWRDARWPSIENGQGEKTQTGNRHGND